MAVDLNYRRIGRDETKAYTICQKSFNRQKAFLEENLEKLYTDYRYNIELSYNFLKNAVVHIYPDKKEREYEYGEEPLAWFWREMGLEDMIEDLKKPISNAVEKGYKKRYRLFEAVLIKNGFEYYPNLITDYAIKFWELNLSNYRGAISYTTKRDVIRTIKDGIDNNLTVDQLARNIQDISLRLFNRARARAIATTEIGKAYEFGNYQPVEQLNSVGVPIRKLRQTCNDSKVRPEHAACEAEGRKPLSYVYPATWVDICPEWVNCRCTMLYDFDL